LWIRVSPFQGSKNHPEPDPGRCPGLKSLAPLAHEPTGRVRERGSENYGVTFQKASALSAPSAVEVLSDAVHAVFAFLSGATSF